VATYSFDDTALDEPLNVVRLLIQDVGPTRWKFSDEVISAYLPDTGSMAQSTNALAAASLCDLLVTRYSGVTDVSEGGASMSGSQLSAQYRQLAKELRARGGISASGIFASAATLDDLYGPAFTRQAGDPIRIYPIARDTCS
jgi:hypothetical protein